MAEEKVSFKAKIVKGDDGPKLDVQEDDGQHTYQIVDCYGRTTTATAER